MQSGAIAVLQNQVTVAEGWHGSSSFQVGSTLAATTYTPSVSTITLAADQYLQGVQTIEGDVNLVGSNILSGVSIFGVSGTATGGGGGSSWDGGTTFYQCASFVP